MKNILVTGMSGLIGGVVRRRLEGPSAISDKCWNYRDLTHPRHALGFVPQDRAEEYPGQNS